MRELFSYVCPVCGNSDPRYLGYKNGQAYCRKCITFQGEKAKQRRFRVNKPVLDLAYELTEEQKEISDKVIQAYINRRDSLIYAVCGAGKTELVFGVILLALQRNDQVGFCLPRREVAKELCERLKMAFPNTQVTLVYGGETERLDGEIIVLTSHQLFRYEKYFDLLIFDEIDAFPYKGNDVLQTFFKRALRGQKVIMTATPSEELLTEFRRGNKNILELRTRFHKHQIPVPQIKLFPHKFALFYVIKKLLDYKKEGKGAFIFCPTIDIAEEFYSKLRLVKKDGEVIHSKKENREEILRKFKNKELSYLVTTSILERGVTFPNLQVIIIESDQEEIFDKETLVQISGRVGRKKDYPDGDVLFLAEKVTPSMKGAIDEIESSNRFLQDMFLPN